MTDKLSVLDYVKALLTPWRGAPPPIPPLEGEPLSEDDLLILPAEDWYEEGLETSEGQETLIFEQEIGTQEAHFPWVELLALTIALVAQISLEPSPERSWGIGLGLYLLAGALVTWANLRGEWVLPRIPVVIKLIDQFEVRWIYLTLGGVSSLLAFYTFGGNRFTPVNLVFWISAIVLICIGFWQSAEKTNQAPIWTRVVNTSLRELNVRISPWLIVLIIGAGLIFFFRVYRFSFVPPEMVSDHAEKILDIWDVLNGEWRVFFPRNTGREGFQMYLTSLVIKLFGSGFSFNSLKIGTILAGLATLPFIYLLGLEISNKKAALLATFFVGIAYWPNVISRMGLRFTLYPFFLAPMLYFLLRGLRRSNRNDFILAGLFLGLGLHGYTPFRIVPFVVLAAVAIFLIHKSSKGFRKQTAFHLLVLILVSLIVFMPLLRYWLENPEMFSYRALTRLGSIESPLPGPAVLIFIKNLWNALIMFFWSNGEIWPVSIPYRPALDIVSASLFFTGVVLISIRYLRRRYWVDLFLILSVPMLMLPSILSLAFPSENPTLNRTAGALIPVFLIIGLSLDGFLAGFEKKLPQPFSKTVPWAMGLILMIWSGYLNYDLVFNQYQENYSQSAWNTSEIGGVIKDFTKSIGEQENTFVVAFPHWVDTRLVGINAGFPTRDFAIWPDDLPKTVDSSGSKLFIIKQEDTDALDELQSLYPDGIVQRFSSSYPGKDFFQFYVFSE